DFAKFYYENGADELLYMDIVASLYERNSLHDIIQKTAEEIFIPLTVGGGLRTIDDIKKVLRAGADKVSLNTAAIKNPNLIKEAAGIFGSSTIAVSIEAIKQQDGSYLAYTDNGREYTGIKVLTWAKKIETLGAGEIVLISIDQEGTGDGYDVELTKMISQAVSIPVVACGGAGSAEDVYQVITAGGADAVIISSILHYDYIQNNPLLKNFEEEGNIEFLKKGGSFSKIKPTSIIDIKKYLKNKGVSVRI
ncbi:MAG: HisA/HisF-related TIM barrel protein, partial [Candidatus Daviesbacteria bacterium]|nr:HisA/HisF-related TIM barrel protein [Candidatus Daviesbacteria bacterium]